MGILNNAMKKSILKVMERWPQIHFSGPKAGRSFADHLVKVAIIAHQIAQILQVEEILNDLDVFNTFYAALIHDTNKLLDGSLRRTALKDNIKELLTFLEVEDDRLLSPENLQKLQFYVALHQDSGPAGMKLLLRDKKDEIIYRVVKFADKFDNFKSADLSLQPSLKSSCERLLQEIVELSEGRFNYAKMFYHALKEFRGMLSEKIHDSLSELLQERFSCVAFARFVDGVVYLCPSDVIIETTFSDYPPPEYRKVTRYILSNVTVDKSVRDGLIQDLSEKLTNTFVSVNDAVVFKSTGIQLKKGIQELPLEKIVDKMLEIAESNQYNMLAVFIQGLSGYLTKVLDDRTLNIPEEEKDKALEDFKKMLKIDEDPFKVINVGGALDKKYNSIASSVPLDNEDIEDLAESFKRRFHDLHEKYVKDSQVKKAVLEFLERNLLINGLGGQSLKNMVETFENYGKYETTCSICGNSKDVIEIEEPETPSLKVQQFTNRMMPHKRSAPRRRVCPVCRIQMLATKRSEFKYSESSPLVLLLPTNYYPEDLIESMKEEMECWDSKEESKKGQRLPLLGVMFSKRLPKAVNFQNTISFQYPAGGFRKVSWQKVSTIAACFATYMISKLPVKVLVTTNLELLQDDIEFNEQIKVQDAGPLVKRILDQPRTWAHIFEYYQQGFLSAQMLFDLVNAPSNFHAAALIVVKEGEIRGRNREEIMLDIFKTLGGDRMEEMRSMAALARKWAFMRARDYRHISDHQFIKPFTDAVRALRKFNPGLGEDENDLKSLVFESVRRSLPEGSDDVQAVEFTESFISFLRKIGGNSLEKSKDVLLRDFAKYKNIFLGNVRLVNLQIKKERSSVRTEEN